MRLLSISVSLKSAVLRGFFATMSVDFFRQLTLKLFLSPRSLQIQYYFSFLWEDDTFFFKLLRMGKITQSTWAVFKV